MHVSSKMVQKNQVKSLQNLKSTAKSHSFDQIFFREDEKIYKTSFSFVEPLAAALAPAYLRFGGTAADMLMFATRKKRSGGPNGTLQNTTRTKFTFTG